MIETPDVMPLPGIDWGKRERKRYTPKEKEYIECEYCGKTIEKYSSRRVCSDKCEP